MTLLYDLQNKRWTNMDEKFVQESIKSGNYSFRDGVEVPVIAPDGAKTTIKPWEATQAFRGGYQFLGQQQSLETLQAGRQQVEREVYDQPGTAAALGGLRGLTAGLSDVAFSALGASEGVAKIREQSPIASTLGEVGGTVLGLAGPTIPSMLARVGAETTAKVGAQVAGKVGQSWLARATEKAIAAGAGGAAEGIGYGLGQVASESALAPHNAPLTAEQAIMTVGLGGVLGGALSSSLSGLSSGGAKTIASIKDYLSGEGSESLAKNYAKILAFARGRSPEEKERIIETFTKYRRDVSEVMQDPNKLNQKVEMTLGSLRETKENIKNSLMELRNQRREVLSIAPESELINPEEYLTKLENALSTVTENHQDYLGIWKPLSDIINEYKSAIKPGMGVDETQKLINKTIDSLDSAIVSSAKKPSKVSLDIADKRGSAIQKLYETEKARQAAEPADLAPFLNKVTELNNLTSNKVGWGEVNSRINAVLEDLRGATSFEISKQEGLELVKRAQQDISNILKDKNVISKSITKKNQQVLEDFNKFTNEFIADKKTFGIIQKEFKEPSFAKKIKATPEEKLQQKTIFEQKKENTQKLFSSIKGELKGFSTSEEQLGVFGAQKRDAQSVVNDIRAAAKTIEGSSFYAKIHPELNEISERLEAKLASAKTSKDIHVAVNEARTTLDKQMKFGVSLPPGKIKETNILLSDVRSGMKKLLEEKRLFGEYGEEYAKLNNLYSEISYLDKAFETAFTKESPFKGGVIREIDPVKVAQYVKNPDSFKSMVKQQSIDKMIEASRNSIDLINSMKINPEQKAVLLDNITTSLESAKKIRGLILSLNQMESYTGKSLQGAVVGYGAGLVLGSGAIGGALGLAGGALANPSSMFRILNHLDRISSDANGQIMSAAAKFAGIENKIPSSLKKPIRRSIYPVTIREAIKYFQPEQEKEDGDEVFRLRSALQNFQDPQYANKVIERNIPFLDSEAPDVHAELSNKMLQISDYLLTQIPPPNTTGAVFGGRQVIYSRSEKERIQRVVDAAFRPEKILHEIDDGKVNPETIETISAIYPNLYEQIKQNVIEAISESGKLDYKKRYTLGLAFGVDSTVALEYLDNIQAAFSQQENQASSGQMASNVDINVAQNVQSKYAS